MQRVPRVWINPQPPPSDAAELAQAFQLPAAIGEVLWRRGLEDPEEAELFLNPRLERLTDPLLLPDMESAVKRIWEAIDAGDNILVFGDYDVDGITSTAFLVQVLRMLGAQVCSYLPHRIEDGYGLSEEVLASCLTEKKPGLLITVDCGTGSVDAVERARKEGLDVIVTDHHESSGPCAPALALVNPKLGDNEELQTLAGVGVAFKLCHALIKIGRLEGRPIAEHADMRPLMYLVALGTVADMVPLRGENRILARFGIMVLNRLLSGENGAEAPVGLQALVRSAGVEYQTLTSYHIGFVLGPRINAAGRILSPEVALRLLLCDDSREAEGLARKLEEANKQRQAIEEGILNDAVTALEPQYHPDEPGVMVVAQRNWHPGVVGIVASRLVRRYHRPAIVISVDENGVGRGSCRSIEGFDLITHLQEVSRYLLQHGGHRMAAGLDIEEQHLDSFRVEIDACAKKVMINEDLRPRQQIDGWLTLEDLSEDFMAAQDRLMPFGHDNPTPVWGIRRIRVDKWQVVGKGRHLRLLFRTPHGMQDAIGFGLGERHQPQGYIDIAFQLRRNVFRGEERLQLMLQDFRPTE